MCTLNIIKAIKKMSVNDIIVFIFENYYKRIGFSKEDSYYSMKRLKKKDLMLLANKLIEKVPDPRNAKEHYQSFLRKENRKSVKQSEIITYKPKIFDTADVKSDITEHSKTSYKLCKSIIQDYPRQAEKVSSDSSLYSDTKKRGNFLNEKNIKITKRKHNFKGYSSTYNVKILNSFNPELQL